MTTNSTKALRDTNTDTTTADTNTANTATTSRHHITTIDTITQATWLSNESGYTDLDDLWATNPDLFIALTTKWRDEHPLAQLGG